MPLHKAISMTVTDGDVGYMMAIMLLARGAQVDAKDAEGEAPIHHACRNRSLPAVQLLLQHGADANVVTSSGSTPLHLLFEFLCQGIFYEAEHLSILRELLAHGAAPARRDAAGLRPYDHINMVDMFGSVDPFRPVMSNILLTAEQDEQCHARRSCLLATTTLLALGADVANFAPCQPGDA